MPRIRLIFLLSGFCLLSPLDIPAAVNPAVIPQEDPTQEYLDFFAEVYTTMQDNYYEPLSRESYDQFVQNFKVNIYDKLKAEGKSNDYVRWRSAAYLVENLKTSEDIFSQFFPPKPAEKFVQEALGQRVDVGIEGEKTKKGFLLNHVEPRSDSYVQGVRENDLLLAIDDQKILKLDEKKINDLLMPLINTSLKLTLVDHQSQKKKTVRVLSKEYFKQSVFLEPVSVPGIYCLQLRLFNRETGDDLYRFLKYVGQFHPRGLILDLRGNPGGPPLAAREISGYFLPPGEEFAYFQKKGQPKSSLDVPVVPEQYRYTGPLVILMDKGSGSSSELFSGVLQRRKRAALMGTNSAGQVMLKSMFNFKDGSMVLLITSRGHFPDGSTFSFQGLTPDYYVPKDYEKNILKAAAIELLKMGAGPS